MTVGNLPFLTGHRCWSSRTTHADDGLGLPRMTGQDKEPTSSPLYVQAIISEIYESRDLLDLGAAGRLSHPSGREGSKLSSIDTSSPPRSVSPAPNALNIFSSAASAAAAAGRRAINSPVQGTASTFRAPQSLSPDRGRVNAQGGQPEVNCVEGYGNNLYVGGSDGVVQWWVCDGVGTSQVSPRTPWSR